MRKINQLLKIANSVKAAGLTSVGRIISRNAISTSAPPPKMSLPPHTSIYFSSPDQRSPCGDERKRRQKHSKGKGIPFCGRPVLAWPYFVPPNQILIMAVWEGNLSNI